MVTATDYLDRLHDDLGKRYSPDTLRTYLSQAKAFLEFSGVKSEYTRADVLSYVDHLIAEKKKRKTIDLTLASIRALFRALVIPWPLTRAGTHLGLRDADEGGPVLPIEDVVKLIAGAKSAKPRLFATIAALSSTFGLRPVEIQAALQQGCDGQRLVLQSAKAGRVRNHQIPATVKPYLSFPITKISRARLHEIFQELMTVHVRAVKRGEGWHSIRRALVSELQMNGVPLETISRFMGWKLPAKGVPETAFRYFRPEAARVDTEIYAKHPFLSFWEE